jgi:hypothetical protein
MITTTWQAVDMLADRLAAQSGPLGLKFVGKYDERLIPKYPAVVVLPGPRAKTLHGTRTFQVAFQLELYIYHANLSLTKRERSKADLQLVDRIEQELETDYRWADETGDSSVIHGYVSSENPGVLQPRAGKSTSVICTRLTWNAISQRRF